MPDMHLKQPRFTYSPSGPFTKNKERLQKFMQTGNTNLIYKIDLDKACFQYDMAYGESKDLTKKLNQIKLQERKLLKLLVVQIMMDIKED